MINRPVELHVNRIKSVKRQRNGIVSFEMLRIRRFDQTRYTIPKYDEEPLKPAQTEYSSQNKTELLKVNLYRELQAVGRIVEFLRDKWLTSIRMEWLFYNRICNYLQNKICNSFFFARKLMGMAI